MWTTDASRYALIELDPTRPAECGIKDLMSGGLVLIDDDEDIVATVKANMRRAGARVLTLDEARPKAT